MKYLKLTKIICFVSLLSLSVLLNTANAKQWSYISNGTIKLGVITDWGAGVGYFSRVSPERNLLNNADTGRQVQQSYYGSLNGLTWSGTPWRWNPVQAGDAYNNPSTVQTFTNDGTSIYAKIIPKDWAPNNVNIAGYMEEWITFPTADTAKIHFKFTYTDSTTQSTADQELPAIYVDYDLPNLVNYRGSSPWTNGQVTSMVPPPLTTPDGTQAFFVTETWDAFVDNNSWGIGVYTPNGPLQRGSMRYNGGASGPAGASCSYVSPIGHWSFSPTTGTNKGPVYEYDVYLTIGTLTDIRSRFYAIHSGGSDTTAPSVTAFTIPTTSTSLTFPINSFTATDNTAVTGYLITESSTPPTVSASGWTSSAPTTYNATSAGNHTLYPWVKDAAGNVSPLFGSPRSLTITLTDTTPPAVSITSPVINEILSDNISVSITATDNVGVAKVELYVDDANDASKIIGTATTSPYVFTWNTKTTTNGSHTLVAKAYDSANNSKTASVSVTVSNTLSGGTYTTSFGNATGSNYPNTVEDTFLNLNTDVNASSTTLISYTWPSYTPANAILMKWNLSALPTNANIQSATLYLYMNQTGGDNSYEMPVSELINKNPVISACNGYYYDGTNSWDPSSVTYNSIPLAQSDIAAPVDAPLIDTAYGYKSWNVTSIVQDWLANPANNFGFMLNASNKASANSYRQFASSKSSDPSQRPKLVITYTVGTAPVKNLKATVLLSN